MKEKYIVLHEEYSSNGSSSEYELVKEIPADLKKGWVANELLIEKTNVSKTIVIMDEGEHYHHGVVTVHLTKASIEEVIQVVKQFDGYNNEILKELLIKIGNGQEITVDETVYF